MTSLKRVRNKKCLDLIFIGMAVRRQQSLSHRSDKAKIRRLIKISVTQS